MKIGKIKQEGENKEIFVVTFVPNFLEKLFGVVEKDKRYKDTGYAYTLGNGTCYIDENGKKLGNRNWIGEAIDNWTRKF